MSNQVTYQGPGLATLLTVLFVGLKLTGHIAWPWVWVMCPLWISIGVAVGIILIALLFMGIAKLVS